MSSDNMIHDDMTDDRLNGLFGEYRDACPQIEPGPNFMPAIWRRIEARRSFSFFFERFARTAMAVSAALCLFLAALNFMPALQQKSHLTAPFYTDALAAEHTAEKTYYTEAIRPIPLSDKIFQEYVHEK